MKNIMIICSLLVSVTLENGKMAGKSFSYGVSAEAWYYSCKENNKLKS